MNLFHVIVTEVQSKSNRRQAKNHLPTSYVLLSHCNAIILFLRLF